MKRLPPWERLKEIASQRCDAQARKLSAATRERDDARRRLETLESYRRDYQARLAEASHRGIDLEALRNYRAFLSQLERAIGQQNEILAGAERSVVGATAQWLGQRRRMQSFQTLDTRQLAAHARDEARREQGLTDEWAARSAAQSVPDTDS
jgi:flagellar protein FliJ